MALQLSKLPIPGPGHCLLNEPDTLLQCLVLGRPAAKPVLSENHRIGLFHEETKKRVLKFAEYFRKNIC